MQKLGKEYLFVVFPTLGGEVDANPTSPAAWCLPWCLQVRKWLQMLPLPIQLLEYQTDIRSPPPPVDGGFAPKRWVSLIVRLPQQLVKIIISLNDTLKGFVRFSCLISTHHLGAVKSAPERWVDLLWLSDSPTARGTPTAYRWWESLHGGQGSTSPQVKT